MAGERNYASANRSTLALAAGLVTVAAGAAVSLWWRDGDEPGGLALPGAAIVAIAVVAPRRRRPLVVGLGLLAMLAGGYLAGERLDAHNAARAAGIAAEVMIATPLLARILRGVGSLRLVEKAVAWMGAALLAASIGAAITSLVPEPDATADVALQAYRWATGDLVGLLLLTPLIWVGKHPRIRPSSRLAGFEAAGSLGVLAGVVVTAFVGPASAIFLAVPWVLWISVRFGPRLAAPAAFATAAATTTLIEVGWSLFEVPTDTGVAAVHAFNLSIAVASLLGGTHAIRLADSVMFLQASLEAVPDLLVVTDGRGTVTRMWGPALLQGAVDELGAWHGRPGVHRVVTAAGLHLEAHSVALSKTHSLTRYRDLTSEVRLSELQRQRSDQLETARRDARVRVGRQLHDGPVQTLTAARLQIEVAGRAAGGTTYAMLQRAADLVGRSIRSLRDSIDELNPPVPAQGELAEALRQLGDEFFAGSAIDFSVEQHGGEPPAGPHAELAYQIAREAVVNARLHASATSVAVRVVVELDQMELTVTDDGVGFDLGAARLPGHLGLALMHERAAEAGGVLTIASAPGTGTRLELRIPIATETLDLRDSVRVEDVVQSAPLRPVGVHLDGAGEPVAAQE